MCCDLTKHVCGEIIHNAAAALQEYSLSSLGQGFSLLTAAQFQALGMLFVAWWGGNWLNVNHPMGVTWYAVTFPVAVLAIAHAFYVVIRHAINQSKTPPPKSGA